SLNTAAAPESEMQSLHRNQKKILEYLLDHPEGATLDEIAAHLDISKTAAKEHINRIESYGYLDYEDSKGSVGRPRRRYLLSKEGHETFPRQYSWLSNALLELLAQDMGPEAVSHLMENLASHVVDSMKQRFSETKSTAELLAELTRAMNELGYRSHLRQSDLRKGAVLEATNCVYHS